MPLSLSENKENIGVREKTDAQTREEIARLRKLIEVKERELKTSLEKSSLRNEILLIREKIKSRGAEYEKIKEAKKETKEEKAEKKEEEGETPERNYEDLSMQRQAMPTKLQVKKITRQIKNADIAHQLTILTNLALTKSVYYAIKIAKKIGNAYLMDRFHDAIVNELFEDLVKTKKLRS